MWCILVLDRRVGSPLMMTCLRAVGRKLDLPPFLWNLSSSSLVLYHPLFSLSDSSVLVIFQPLHHCFPVSNHLTYLSDLQSDFVWLDIFLTASVCLADGPICCLIVESSALPIPLFVHLFNYRLYMLPPAFFVPVTPVLHLIFGCHTSKVGIFSTSSCSFWPAGDSSNLWLQGVLILLFVFPIVYL